MPTQVGVIVSAPTLAPPTTIGKTPAGGGGGGGTIGQAIGLLLALTKAS